MQLIYISKKHFIKCVQMMQKFLITGEIYEYKKRYVVFSSGEEYVFNIQKCQSSNKPSEEDKLILLKLRDKELVDKLIKEQNNFWHSIDFTDNEGKEIRVSNIKCYTYPTLISYELEQYRSALYN